MAQSKVRRDCPSAGFPDSAGACRGELASRIAHVFVGGVLSTLPALIMDFNPFGD
jgi:hypothetical protein